MGFFFVKSGWDKELGDALRRDNSELRVICPFIKKAAAARLLDRGKPRKLLVITRASLDDFYGGVSDIEALRLLLQNGAQIRVVRNLHTKLYIFGNARVILTSANLTERALRFNHEFGFVADSNEVVRECMEYFNELWIRSRHSVSAAKLAAWHREVSKYTAKKARWKSQPGLPDYGTEIDHFTEPAEPELVQANGQAFVKFFGEAHRRADRSRPIFEEVKNSGSHWACTYPKGKRPRSVRNGALMFIARLVAHSRDALIYGRAIGERYQRGRDDASAGDIRKRRWKKRWPHYIRVHNPEFINGRLSDGVSLKELMHNLGSDAFASTQRNAARKHGNTDPKQSLRQQPAVRLSSAGAAWMTRRLDKAFQEHGKLSRAKLNKLDWPKLR